MAGTGYTGPIRMDYAKVLNPLDFSEAGALKGLLFGVIVSKVASKLGANRYMKKIPLIGKWIKV